MMCRDDWYSKFGTRAIDHFGRIHESKRVDNVWASGQFTDEEMSWIMLLLIIPKAHHLIKNSDEWRNFQAMKKASVH